MLRGYPRFWLTAALLAALGPLACSGAPTAADAGAPPDAGADAGSGCNSACALGLTCLGSACVPIACASDLQCPGALQCVGGFCSSQGCTPACDPDAGLTCLAGACVQVGSGCAAGETTCSDGCVDLQGNSQNCGACDHACSAGDACAGGGCHASCGANLSLCTVDGGDTLCADLAHDPGNCGSCGHACGGLGYCQAGSCLQPSCSEATVSLPLADDPTAIVAGDLNGDGFTDFAWLSSAGAVEVVLNQGDGGFGAPVSVWPDAGEGRALAIADFNGDGVADILISSIESVQVVYGLADGGYLPASAAIPLTCCSEALAVADFNGDGLADVAISGIAEITVLLSGDGGLQPTVYTAGTGFTEASLLAAVDFDGSGKPDLADVTGVDLELRANDGQGAFASAQVVSATLSAAALGAGPLGPDGGSQLAAIGGATLELVGDGALGFTSSLETQQLGALAPAFSSMAVGAFGGGSAGVALSDSANDLVWMLARQADGGFGPTTFYATDPGPYGLMTGNFAGSPGRTDLALRATTAVGEEIELFICP